MICLYRNILKIKLRIMNTLSSLWRSRSDQLTKCWANIPICLPTSSRNTSKRIARYTKLRTTLSKGSWTTKERIKVNYHSRLSKDWIWVVLEVARKQITFCKITIEILHKLQLAQMSTMILNQKTEVLLWTSSLLQTQERIKLCQKLLYLAQKTTRIRLNCNWISLQKS